MVSVFYGQKKNSKKLDMENLDYKRSSLYVMMAENPSMPYADAAYNGFYNNPFPDKYNEHTVGPRSFDFSSIDVEISDSDMTGQGVVDALLGKGVLDIAGLEKRIAKYAKEHRVAAQMVAKWFGRNAETGSFNVDLISERGFYDASALDAAVASTQARGSSALADAGEQLIGKTFLVVNKFTSIDNAVLPQALIAKAAVVEAGKMKADNAVAVKIREKAVQAAQKAYEKIASGYSMVAKPYLFQLEWNDSIANIFYNTLWVYDGMEDSLRQATMAAFDSTDLFKLNYVGTGKTTMAGPLYPGSKNGTEADIIAEGTVRSLNKAYNKLSKKYAAFAVKTPLLTGGKKPTAKIGMKEGIQGGETFNVFEQRFDDKTNKTIYKQVGSITVDKKKPVWDNRYYITDKPETKQDVEFTTFKGGSKSFYPGMLIQQATKNK